MFWVGFGIGCILGGNLGVLVMALFQVNKD